MSRCHEISRKRFCQTKNEKGQRNQYFVTLYHQKYAPPPQHHQNNVRSYSTLCFSCSLDFHVFLLLLINTIGNLIKNYFEAFL